MAKNILIVHHCGIIGGAEKSLLDFLETVHGKNNQDYQFSVICPNNGTLITELRKRKINPHPLPLIRFKRSKNIFILFFYIFIQISTSIHLLIFIKKKKINLIHANTMGAFLSSLFPAKICSIPILVHLRDCVKKGSLDQKILKFANHIISISNYVGTTVSSNHHDKHSTLYNGIVPPPGKKSTLTPKCPEKYILMAAQFVPWKRHDLAIDAIKLIVNTNPNCKMVLVGNMTLCPGKTIKRLRKNIKNYQLQNTIQLLDYQSDIYSIMKNASLLIHPAENEPLGRVVIEAMQLNIPVVAADTGGIKEYIIDQWNGFLFQSGNAVDLANKIVLAFNYPGLDSLLNNAKKTAHYFFDNEKQSKKILTLYEKHCH